MPEPEVPARARTRTYCAAYKARVLEEYDGLDKAGKGALLRRKGLYTSLVSAWRQQRDQVALAALVKPAGRPPMDPMERENAKLCKENERLQAERLLADTIAKQHIDRDTLTIHADNGSSMACEPVAFLLADLGVTKSHSRPRRRRPRVPPTLLPLVPRRASALRHRLAHTSVCPPWTA